MNNLPRHQRQVIALRIFEQLNVEQTAQAMGYRPSTVKALAFKGVQNLRHAMNNDIEI